MAQPIVVASSRGPYEVIVADGALARLPALVRAVNPAGRAFAVAGAGVLVHHRERIESALGDVRLIPIEDGEDAKTLAAVERLFDALIESGAKRDSLVIAIGGGTVGDAAGFAASILFRGVDLIHVPTTLLAQVDSSIGGKVAINHPRGKNLIGSFWPPRAVLADPAFLGTLPPMEFLSGAFEALKCGVIMDEALFDLVRGEYHTIGSSLEELVRRAISVKAAIVGEDEMEKDRRRLLNYGHTIGHAIEAALGYGSLTHGEAVAWGMIGANAIAARRGLLPQGEHERIDSAIRTLSPRSPGGAGRARVLAAAGVDKKVSARGRAMVLPRRVGECAIVEDVTDEELALGVDAALGG